MLLGSGERVSGEEVREQNVQAAVAIANIVKTSLGPHGLDKMMVDDIGVSFSFPIIPPFLSRIYLARLGAYVNGQLTYWVLIVGCYNLE